MKMRLQEKYIMQFKIQRDVLPWKANSDRVDRCAPPSSNYLKCFSCQSERMSLCVLKGSLTIEAALIFPFFLMVLFAFFSFFSTYASAAEIQVQAAAEARSLGIAVGGLQRNDCEEITIYKTSHLKNLWINPFEKGENAVQKAVCRGWIGFTELEMTETYVYITPDGNVYHLYADCTHLDLSIRSVTMADAKVSKNDYSEKYKKCERCKDPFGTMVYITSEGNRYHSDRNCGGLKRTIRHVPMSEVQGRSVCIRCTEREG